MKEKEVKRQELYLNLFRRLSQTAINSTLS